MRKKITRLGKLQLLSAGGDAHSANLFPSDTRSAAKMFEAICCTSPPLTFVRERIPRVTLVVLPERSNAKSDKQGPKPSRGPHIQEHAKRNRSRYLTQPATLMDATRNPGPTILPPEQFPIEHAQAAEKECETAVRIAA